MRAELIDRIKLEIEDRLKQFLRDEGIELRVAANDNGSPRHPAVLLEEIAHLPLAGSSLLVEIRLILSVLGKPWFCDALVEGIYTALCPHRLTRSELAVLLMSLHVETVACPRPRRVRRRAVMRYIVEEEVDD